MEVCASRFEQRDAHQIKSADGERYSRKRDKGVLGIADTPFCERQRKRINRDA
jgi:hypothetical protein